MNNIDLFAVWTIGTIINYIAVSIAIRLWRESDAFERLALIGLISATFAPCAYVYGIILGAF